ncbi:PAS domain-containing protein [Pontibacter ramchanderi]|uniref:histidine kinase n=1 Tax=Pontibacter ramchanderi TaxID=1179743 RepID=A0A2N3U8C7_9BACT|nr:PAS domain-containing protein [Pontibacter ramchanderi]PKV63009.1 PAS domain S-box-containing protein [Pontibacter ramchanderi]
MDFNKLFDKIPEPIVVLSPAYKVVAATDSFLKTSLRTREQVIGKHFLLEVFPDKEHAYEDNPVKKGLDRVMATKQPVRLSVTRYDIKLSAENYEMRYWEINQTPVLDDAGNVEYILQQPLDVTEREITQEALSQSEEKFTFMAEVMPQLIYTLDPNGKPTYFNKRWETYTGVPMEKLLQPSWELVVHPEDLPTALDKWKTAIETGQEMQVELRLRDKKGVYRWHLSRSIPMKDAEGKTTMWVGSSTDIHDTRQLVQELLTSNEEMALLADQVQHAYDIAESERKTLQRLIMEAPAMFVILKGPEHRFELLNDQYQQIYPDRNLIGLPLGEALPEIKAQGFVELLDEVYRTGKTFVAQGVPIVLPKAGTGEPEERFFNFSYQPIFEAEQVVGILAFGYDISNEIRYKRMLENPDTV